MNILVAPDKFKGSLTANEVCEAIAAGVKKIDRDFSVKLVPLADGGEGTLSVLQAGMALQKITLEVADPLFRPVKASYLAGDNKAYIEMAAASGLELLAPEERNCLYTTTYGTGQLIKDALLKNASEIYLFIGGSATNDAGTGMANALGYVFVNEAGEPVSPIGKNLVEIKDFYPQNPVPGMHRAVFYVVCDVQNRLSGPNGAAHVYAAQKGADSEAISLLDDGLMQFGQLIHKKSGRDISNKKGSGAAGGLGAGAMAFLDASMKSGIKTVMDIVGLESLVKETDLIISGEGKFDRQTLEGKVVAGVGSLAVKYQKPFGVICGIKDDGIANTDLIKLGISKLLTLKKDDMSVGYAIENAHALLVERSEELIKIMGAAKD